MKEDLRVVEEVKKFVCSCGEERFTMYEAAVTPYRLELAEWQATPVPESLEYLKGRTHLDVTGFMLNVLTGEYGAHIENLRADQWSGMTIDFYGYNDDLDDEEEFYIKLRYNMQFDVISHAFAWVLDDYKQRISAGTKDS